MSSALDFLSIDLEVVRGFFAGGDAELCAGMNAEMESSQFQHQQDEETQEERKIWEEIVKSLSGGKLGTYLASQPGFGAQQQDAVSEWKALAIASIVRHFGESVGAVGHSNAAGDIFRAETFEYLNQLRLLPVDAGSLIYRPLFGQVHDIVPSWGGLTRQELARIPLDRLSSTRADSGDTDVDSWAGGILNSVEEAILRGVDLVTLYE